MFDKETKSGKKGCFKALKRVTIAPFIAKNLPSVRLKRPFVGHFVGRSGPPISRNQQGFTLIELMTVVVILGIILAFAMPAMNDLVQRNRLVGQTNDLVTDLKLARTTALTTGMPATICASDDGEQCGGSWNDGWIVFYDCDGNGQLDDDPSDLVCPNINGLNQVPEQLIKVQSGVNDSTTVTEIQNSGTGNKVRYNSVGLLLSPTADHILRICADSLENGRRITITQAGRAAITAWLSTEASAC